MHHTCLLPTLDGRGTISYFLIGVDLTGPLILLQAVAAFFV